MPMVWALLSGEAFVQYATENKFEKMISDFM